VFASQHDRSLLYANGDLDHHRQLLRGEAYTHSMLSTGEWILLLIDVLSIGPNARPYMSDTKTAHDWRCCGVFKLCFPIEGSACTSTIGLGPWQCYKSSCLQLLRSSPHLDVPKIHNFNSDLEAGILSPVVTPPQPLTSTDIAGKKQRSIGQQTRCWSKLQQL